MEVKQNTEQSKKDNESKKLDILDFIEKCNGENYYEMLISLLESESLIIGKTVRESLELQKPIVNNDDVSIHPYQMEHIQVKGNEKVKTKTISTILTVYCVKAKQGELFRNEHECLEKLYKLSKDCINLQSLLAPECNDDNILLFSSCRFSTIESDKEQLFYYTVIAYNKVGTIH